MTTPKNPTRPTSLEDWLEKRDETVSPHFLESVQHGFAFEAKPTDVFISPYAKCGTTWLQQIVYGLKTGGDIDFDDISRVVPWIETAHFLGLDLEAPQPGPFRAFKSHLSRHEIPKGGRYIVSFRNPKDALLSNYRFFDGWHWEQGAVSLSEFARAGYLHNRDGNWRWSYWYHFVSWWEQRHNPQVLLLCFELMRQNPAKTVARVADFLNVEGDEALLALVLKQSSLEFMSAHKDKFDDLLMRERFEEIGFVPASGDAAKVRTGRVGDHRLELPPDISAEMDAVWAEVVEAQTGLTSYEAVQEALEG